MKCSSLLAENLPQNSNNVAIECSQIGIHFPFKRKAHTTLRESFIRLIQDRHRKKANENVWVLRDISFKVFKGESIAIVGQNGSGKSTLLKLIAGILMPDEGTFSVNGKLAALIELGAGFHPELSGRENIYLNAAVMGMSTGQIKERFEDIVNLAQLHQFIDQPLKTYSSGMRVRLGFAIAINMDPDILLIDEVMAVGDAEFKEKCLSQIEIYLQKQKSLIFVSHNLNLIQRFCEKALYLKDGKYSAFGNTQEVLENYIKDLKEKNEKAIVDSYKKRENVKLLKVINLAYAFQNFSGSVHGVAIGGDDSLFFTDYRTHQIKRIDLKKNEIRLFGQYGVKSGAFIHPNELYIDGSQNLIYISDQGNHRVQILDSEGKFSHFFGKKGEGSGEFIDPVGLVCDNNNHIFVSDYGNERIQEFDSHGNFIRIRADFTKHISARVGPQGLCALPDGNLLVTTYLYNRILSVDDDGNPQVFSDLSGIGSNLRLHGICHDSNRNIYVCERRLGLLIKLDCTGQLVYAEALLDKPLKAGPTGIAIDADDNLYVADFFHNSIYIVKDVSQ